jgi:hypothetical protein
VPGPVSARRSSTSTARNGTLPSPYAPTAWAG